MTSYAELWKRLAQYQRIRTGILNGTMLYVRMNLPSSYEAIYATNERAIASVGAQIIQRNLNWLYRWGDTGLSPEDIPAVRSLWPAISPDTHIRKVHYPEWRYVILRPFNIREYTWGDSPQLEEEWCETRTCSLTRWRKGERTFWMGYAPEIDTLFWM